MDTNINHFNSRKEYMDLVYHNPNPEGRTSDIPAKRFLSDLRSHLRTHFYDEKIHSKSSHHHQNKRELPSDPT
jgi:hypothetical protein